jgi:hypothetical protein
MLFRLLGSSQIVLLEIIDYNMLVSYRNIFKLIFMELVEISNVQGIMQINVSIYLIENINSIWPLRTQIVKTTSLKNSLSMASREISYRLL